MIFLGIKQYLSYIFFDKDRLINYKFHLELYCSNNLARVHLEWRKSNSYGMVLVMNRMEKCKYEHMLCAKLLSKLAFCRMPLKQL